MKMTASEKLLSRVSSAIRLDSDMRKALRDRLQSIHIDEAERAISKIEDTRRRSIELRRIAEQRRQERESNHKDGQKRVSEDLIGHAQAAVKQVLQETAAVLEAQGVAAEIAAPIVHASVDNWVEHILSPRAVADLPAVPVPGRFVPEKQIDAVEALDGLTKIEAYCWSLGAIDAVVGVNSGGSIVASYLAERLGIGAIYKATTAGGNVAFSQRIPSNMRVLVVDDIARSGRTVTSVWESLRTAGIMHASYITLVSSMACRAALGNVPLYSPVMSGRSDAALPWSTRGKLVVEGDNYVFGGEAALDTFAIPRQQADFIVRRLRERRYFK